MGSILAPGDWVKLASAPDWGQGQVQSVAGERITVNFAEAGKKVVRIDAATLIPVQQGLEGS